MTTAPPPEHPGGQETEPPNVLLFVSAALHLLEDLKARRVEGDLELRRAALLSVARRLRKHLEEGGSS